MLTVFYRGCYLGRNCSIKTIETGSVVVSDPLSIKPLKHQLDEILQETQDTRALPVYERISYTDDELLLVTLPYSSSGVYG